QPILNPPVCKCSRATRRWWRPRSARRPAEAVNAAIRCIDRDNRAGRRSPVDWRYPDAGDNRAGRVWRPWHQALVWHRAGEFRERELSEGVCLRCIHPQMRCEEPRHNEGRIREIWEWLTPGAKTWLQRVDGLEFVPEW
ncbi:hypothetical protein LZ30DRAFT_585903, partial [Colletotrichum cereale]